MKENSVSPSVPEAVAPAFKAKAPAQQLQLSQQSDASSIKQMSDVTIQLNAQFYGEQRAAPNVTLNQAIALEQEVAQQTNQKQRVLEQTLQNNDAEQRAIYHVQINNFLNRWKDAWQTGQVENYLKFYGKKFKPEKGTYQQWHMSRAVKVMPSRNIKVLLGQPEIEFTDNMHSARVTFRQEYHANDFQDISYKALLLERRGSDWLILREYELSDLNRG